ncbi:MAG: immune inhibitor A [Ignavibacteriales bacterium]|nr:immune inhibitor A [Ignavibacteriales bacterium]
MKSLFTITFLVFSITISAQNYKQISIPITSPNDFIILAQNGIDLEHSSLSKSNNLNFFVSEDDLDKINSLGFSYTVLIDDWKSFYNQQAKPSDSDREIYLAESKNNFNVDGFGFGSMGGYYTLAEIAANLDSMYAQYPNIITQKYSIGTSQQSRTIWAVKISDNPTINEGEPPVGFDALVHAREPQSMATLMYYMWYLLQNYGTDPEVTYLVNNREIYCVPCFNPDGYEYNRSTDPSGGGMWRKNRRNNGDGSFGVDLNRNFGYQWGYDNIGSSPTPSSETYRGPSAFSEPECQAIRDLATLRSYKTYFNMHTYGGYILYPWGYIDAETPDSLAYREFASLLTSKSGYAYGSGSELLGYPSNGSIRDWMFGEQTLKGKTYGYTIEIGDAFWPLQSQIFPIAQQNLSTMIYQTYLAGAYTQLVDPGYSEEFIDPGENVLMNSTFKNVGLATAYNLQIQLSSLSPYINVTANTAQFDSIPARSNAALTTPLTFNVLSTAPTDVTVKLLLTSSFSGTVVNQDTISFILGTPMFVFADTTNDPLTLWDITATPSTKKWEATNTTFYSSPTSFTDSKIGDYLNNATVTMMLKNAVDLTNHSNPRLTFWTKYDIESNWDYGQVEASTNNGSTWFPLQGLYTEPGTGSFQPNGEPLYDGVRTNWVKEEISLTGFNSNQFKLKFELKSDGSQVQDGWYIDDIGIIVYGIVPVELISFTASIVDGKAELKWQTASELNNAGFDIEKAVFNQQSAIGNKKNWSKIGFVNGHGTTTEINNYNFMDESSLEQKTFYRLKQLDFDGTFSYSDEVEIDASIPIKFSLEQNYPNPFNPSTKINWQSPVSSWQTLKIYDIIGNEVATLVNEYRLAGSYEIDFQSSIGSRQLANGVYFYQLRVGDYIGTKKMILIK